MITLEAYWKGPDARRRDLVYANQITDEIRENAEVTVDKVNELLERAGIQRTRVPSGWRPKTINEQTANAAVHSTHLDGQGIDVEDDDRELVEWCLAHLPVLAELGLWMEHPGWTPGWCHLQTRPPGWPPNPNGPRCYIPSSKPPMTTQYGTKALYT